jgi:3D (Asp-Asp-Asp) domain-containing protein
LSKKIVAIMLMLLATPVFSATVPQAKAAFLEDRLSEAVAGEKTANQIQELINMQKALTQEDKQLLVNALAKNVLARTGRADVIDELSVLTQQQPVQESAASKADIVAAVETAMRSNLQNKIKEEVDNRLAGYQDKFALLANLLNNSNALVPQAVQNNNSLTGEPQNYRKLLDMTATAYGPGPLDNGKWNDLTYDGGRVKKGVVAVDPAVIPMGTKLWVEGYGAAVAEDQGKAIKGNRIDLAFNTRQEALDYGIQKVKVYVLN